MLKEKILVAFDDPNHYRQNFSNVQENFVYDSNDDGGEEKDDVSDDAAVVVVAVGVGVGVGVGDEKNGSNRKVSMDLNYSLVRSIMDD